MTYSRFDDLRLPEVGTRNDQPWERVDHGKEHRDKVLRALLDSVVQFLVARSTYGEDADANPEFQQRFVDPLWDELGACLTRQDLLRWLVDWARQAAQQKAFGEIERLQQDLNSLGGV